MYKYKFKLINSNGRPKDDILISYYITSTEWRMGTIISNTWEIVNISYWDNDNSSWIVLF